MLKRMIENKKLVIAIIAVVFVLAVSISCILLGGTDAYFSDNTSDGIHGGSAKLDCDIVDIDSSFYDSVDRVLPMLWGSINEHSFTVENKESLSADLYATLKISSSDPNAVYDWEKLAQSITIYDKDDAIETDGVFSLNEGAAPIGNVTVTETGIEIALPKETVSGASTIFERRVEWINKTDGTVISNKAYKELSASEKEKYEECGSSHEFGLLVVFNGDAEDTLNLQLDIDLVAYKRGNKAGWNDTDGFTKYGQVIYSPYRNLLEPGPEFNAHLFELAGMSYDGIAPQSDEVEKMPHPVRFTSDPVTTEFRTIDVSYAKDGSVVAWFDTNKNTIFVVPTSGGEIKANEDCSWMFQYCSGLVYFDNINSSKTTTMRGMFYQHGVFGLNLTGLETSEVLDMSHMFDNSNAGNEINFGDAWDTAKVEDMSYMFRNYGGGSSTSVPLERLDTSSALNMSYMFADTSGTFTFPAGWDTSKVTNMSHMFEGSRATWNELDWSEWNTAAVEDMSYMFRDSQIVWFDVNLTGLDNHNVKYMQYMFADNPNMTSITFGEDWNSSKVINMSHMFAGCASASNANQHLGGLTSIDFTNFDTDSCEDMSYMFYYNPCISTLDLSNFDTSNVKDMSYMFADCNDSGRNGTFYLSSINMSSFDTSNVINMSHMFANIGAATLDVTGFNTSSCEDMSYMFYGAGSLTTLNVTGFDTSKVKNIAYMFYDCRKLSTLDVSAFNTVNVEDMQSMFEGCYLVKTLAVNGANWNTGKVKYMNRMFAECRALTSLDVSKWNTANVEDMNNMFYNCTKMTTLGSNSFDTSKVTNMEQMFYNCQALKTLDVSTWNTPELVNASKMFYYCNALTSLDLNHWDVSALSDMSYMFYWCNRLTNLNIGDWNTSNVTTMSHMFDTCKGLKELDLSKWDTPKLTDISYIFEDCTSLTLLNINGWDVSNVTNADYAFYGAFYSLRELDLSEWEFEKEFTAVQMFGKGQWAVCEISIIWANDWTDKITSTEAVFGGNTYLVGDTVAFSENHLTKDMATPDGGYFTKKPDDTTNMLISGYRFKSAIPSNASIIIFTNTVDTTKTLTDLSIDGDGSVVGWLNGSTYYIGSVNGEKIIANKTCKGMFQSNTRITKIDFTNLDTSLVIDMSYMFYGCSNLKDVNASLMNTDNVISMANMFYNCNGLVTLDTTGWTLDKVVTTSYMFRSTTGSSKLTTILGTENWTLKNCIDTSYMFHSMTNLGPVLNLDSMTLSSLENGNYMFSGLSALQRVFLNSVNLPTTVQNTSYMFKDCPVLSYIYAKDWTNKTYSNLYSSYMFSNIGVTKATEKEDITMATPNGGYFSDHSEPKNTMALCYAFYPNIPTTAKSVVFNSQLTAPASGTIDVSDAYDGSVVGWLEGTTFYVTTTDNSPLYLNKDSAYMFYNNTKITSVDFGDVIFDNVEDMQYMFYGCSALTEIKWPTVNTSKVTNMQYMFYGCQKFTSTDILSMLNTASVEDMQYMFYNFGASGVTDVIDIGNWDVSSVINMQYMFSNADAAVIKTPGWNVEKVTNMKNMFYATTASVIDVTGWNPVAVTNVSDMFARCTNLTTIYGGDWSSIKSLSTSMFSSSSKLVGAVPYSSSSLTWTMANPTTGYFTSAASLTANHMMPVSIIQSAIPTTAKAVVFTNSVPDGVETIDLSLNGAGGVVGWLDETTYYISTISGEKVIAPVSLSGMFKSRTALTTVDLTYLDTSNVTDMFEMFYGCSKLTDVTIGNIDVSKVQNMSYMFYNCSSLLELNLSGWNVASVTDTSRMFYGCSKLTTIYAGDWTTMVTTAPTSTQMFTSCSKLVGAASFSSSKVTWTMANATDGYFSHAMGAWVSAASLDCTCQDSVVYQRSCVYCGYTETKEMPGPHIFVNNVCTECGVSHIEITTEGTYKFTREDNVFTSNNAGVHSSTAQSELTVISSNGVTVNWSVSSEKSFDILTIIVDGTKVVAAVSDIKSGAIEIESGTHTVVLQYTKDGTGSGNDDKAIVEFVLK